MAMLSTVTMVTQVLIHGEVTEKTFVVFVVWSLKVGRFNVFSYTSNRCHCFSMIFILWIQFNSVLFIYRQITTNVISRHLNDAVQVKLIGIQFIVIIIQSNPINSFQNNPIHSYRAN